MKKTFVSLCLILMMALVMGQPKPKQPAYELKNGVIVQKDPKTRTKTPDKVYQKIGDKVFYKGAKGGVYYIKKSPKTGKDIKVYLKSK